jgi:hypothetical protein
MFSLPLLSVVEVARMTRRRRLRALRARRPADPLLVELGLDRVPSWYVALALAAEGLL